MSLLAYHLQAHSPFHLGERSVGLEGLVRAIAEHRIDPGCLVLELTESLLVDDVEGVIEKMSALKARGVGFSLDDFGTGYSSLTYLKRLPLDQLKIDQSFVRDVLTDVNDAAIARSIIALGAKMRFTILAEGVPAAALTVDHNLIDGFRGQTGELRGADYVEGAPAFVNATGADFHLQPTSPAIDHGAAWNS